MSSLFLYGTLCHLPLLRLVSGSETPDVIAAILADYGVRWVKDGNYPAIAPAKGKGAAGLLVQNLSDTQMARLSFYELMFGYELRTVTLHIDGQPLPAQVYFPTNLPDLAAPWSLDDWVRDVWGVTCHAATEIMSYFGYLPPETVAQRWGMIQTRAASKARAETSPVPTSLRADFGRDQVQVDRHNRPHAGFFTLETNQLSFRQFNGAMSAPVEREGFVGGDAAIVLPYDAKRDLVMLVEQFRFGPYLRGDSHPWVLEPIAGRIDGGESPQDCARREALEEAGLQLTALEHISSYYPSPGAVTEFYYTYLGLTDLDLDMAGLGGLDAEDEDIRTHVISFERLMGLVSSGEAACGPLVLAALWLQQNRPRLRAQA